MLNPPPRNILRFQIHLSTAVVMMFVSGGLIWSNTREHPIETLGSIMRRSETDKEVYLGVDDGFKPSYVTERIFLGTVGGDAWVGSRDVAYGWPLTGLITRQEVLIVRDLNQASPNGHKKNDWHIEAMIVNVSTALVILLAVCALCEWLIRRSAEGTLK